MSVQTVVTFDPATMFANLTNRTAAQLSKRSERKAKATRNVEQDKATRQERMEKAGKKYGPVFNDFAGQVQALERALLNIGNPAVTSTLLFGVKNADGTVKTAGAFDAQLFTQDARKAIVAVEKLFAFKAKIGA